jgi:hypothetical protein
MIDHGGLWAIATVVGPLLLLAALAYGVLFASRRSKVSKQHTEEVTRSLYERAAQQERHQEAASPSIVPAESETARIPRSVER